MATATIPRKIALLLCTLAGKWREDGLKRPAIHTYRTGEAREVKVGNKLVLFRKGQLPSPGNRTIPTNGNGTVSAPLLEDGVLMVVRMEDFPAFGDGQRRNGA
ncbi:hypothetical protein HAX54_046253 [Datura stramonium]|uniref:Uncharacterized protein n=1 Tax=Datura stramonium TaxID=4076 RepID=A0ABS8SSY7_DATST|nr:hypothetical protein [Datura stramonium]